MHGGKTAGICFLGKINYNDFIRRFLGERPGPVVELETGKVIGQHRGYWFHTIGQRKGLGLGGGPWFVVDKNVEENIIYVSHGYDTEKQFGHSFCVKDFHFITLNPCKEQETEILFQNTSHGHLSDWESALCRRRNVACFQQGTDTGHSARTIRGDL